MPKKTNNKLLYWNTSNIDGARAHRDINIEEIVEGTCKYQHLILHRKWQKYKNTFAYNMQITFAFVI